jgi:1-deoxy-D-xylulose-5-phosphate reductoisomerase
MSKRIAIYGSTGSIGTQALAVVDNHPELFEVAVLTAHNNAELLIEQSLQYKPNVAIISNEEKYEQVNAALSDKGIKVYAGETALIEVAAGDTYDILLAAIVGFAGLSSTLAAVEQGKTVALANKETLVVAGDIVMASVAQYNAKLIPVDSEHSALFQCLVGESMEEVSKVILTASGGPFLGKKPNYLVNVKRDHALQHPNWEMGAKISIDSASLMNKGLEMIEAKWMFGLKNEQIDVVVHPQSIVHSFVEFIDGSQKAQMGLPDMKLPIQYALAYPKRLANNYPRYINHKHTKLTFEEADLKTFRNLGIAIEAMKQGGNVPCIMNAANEIAVAAFLKNKIGFLEMSDLIEKSIEKIDFIATPSLHDYKETDRQTRQFCQRLIKD